MMDKFLIDAVLDAIAWHAFGAQVKGVNWAATDTVTVSLVDLRYALMDAFEAGQDVRRRGKRDHD